MSDNGEETKGILGNAIRAIGGLNDGEIAADAAVVCVLVVADGRLVTRVAYRGYPEMLDTMSMHASSLYGGKLGEGSIE